MEAPEPAHEDDTATEPPATEEHDAGRDDSGSKGGPYGNPAVDEETLRKKQEEAQRRRPEEDD